MTIWGEIGHFGAGRKWPKSNTVLVTIELISVHQTIKRDPNNGLDESGCVEQTENLNFFYGDSLHVDTTYISLGARSENFWSLRDTLLRS